jgi:beta-glucosidase
LLELFYIQGTITNTTRHGLSYTTFTLSSLAVVSDSESGATPSIPCHNASVTITNTGPCPGSETLQLYISAPHSSISHARPRKELHGFEKVFLQPEESKTIEITIDRYATSFWDESEGKWLSEKGTYDVLIGTSSSKIVLKGEFHLKDSRYWLGL